MIPKEKAALVLVANSTLALLPRSNDAALECLVSLRPEPPAAVPTKPTGSDLRELPGVYANGSLVVEVKAIKDELVMEFGPDERFHLARIQAGLFSLRFKNPALVGTPYSTDIPVKSGPDGKPGYLYFLGRALRRRAPEN
jgi:hypothetical protein